MSSIERGAKAVWTGTLREGAGSLTTDSGVLNNSPYTFPTRFENAPGTNPEELIAAAEAACFTMQVAATLGRRDFKNVEVYTTATTVLSQVDGGRKITKIVIYTRGKGDNLDAETFKAVAEEAKTGCIISRALAGVDEFVLDADLAE